ncbi:MAG: ThiF family adenylyltransferase [Planctomycetes bacterium]|nr:ThiF family adenylyltransferase [Planctomycetota bacterium]
MKDFDKRFERQTRFAALGRAGQAQLSGARVLVVGCGALGGALAQNLARSGVGELVLVDRDIVEESNLPRQVLFDERHARERTEKSLAAKESLARIGGPTRVEALVEHVDADNIERLTAGAHLVVDGTDNLETRYLVNDVCVERDLPWVYGGVVGAGGLVLPVLPGVGPCLACLFPEPPPPGVLPTCETAGVLQPAVALIAALQSGLALRILTARSGLTPRLYEVDVWDGRVRELGVGRDPRCRCCGLREFRFLHEPVTQRATSLCGRNTVQVRGARVKPDLQRLAQALEPVARDVRHTGAILRFAVDDERYTVFADGRALIEGTDDLERALTLYDRYIGT